LNSPCFAFASPVKQPAFSVPKKELLQARTKPGRIAQTRVMLDPGWIRLDQEGAVSDLILGPLSAGSSGAAQADVATGCGLHIEIGLRQQIVTKRLQQTPGDILECASEGQDAVVAILFGQGPVQAVVVQQLHQQMADLQEIIMGLGMVPVLAKDVAQVQVAVFLNVEAFVFDFGA